MTLKEKRDNLLRTSEYKGTDKEIPYAMGILDLYNEIEKSNQEEKHTSPTMAKVKK